MIEVEEAVAIIDKTIITFPQVVVPLEKALGRVLRQEINADADFPPFDRVMMDGIAIKTEDLNRGVKAYKIAGIQGAGSTQIYLENNGTCLEVMTGAVAPKGADVIIPYEDVTLDTTKGIAHIQVAEIKKGKNIHKQGTDKKAGDLLISEGTLIGTPEIAMAASVGLTKLKVTKMPSVAIISTGNELVEIQKKPLSHQIRRSNVYAIAAELQKFGIKSDMFHFSDDKANLLVELEKVLADHDLIILSGGVSKGKFDYIPETLEKLGVKKLFHRIKQKPGKPFWFGEKGGEKVVFAFPGNPVSTFLCYHKYLAPWLKKSLGLEEASPIRAILVKDFSIKSSFTYYLQVKTEISEDGQLLAFPIAGKGSGDHANLLSSDAFLELPGNKGDFKKGEVYNLIPFRNI